MSEHRPSRSEIAGGGCCCWRGEGEGREGGVREEDEEAGFRGS